MTVDYLKPLFPEVAWAQLRFRFVELREDWDEDDHPRDDHGRFEGGGDDGGASEDTHPAAADPDPRATGPTDFGSKENNETVRSWTSLGGSAQMSDEDKARMTKLIQDQGEKSSIQLSRGVAMEGMSQEEVDLRFGVGGRVNMGPSSFSTDESHAQIYSDQGGGFVNGSDGTSVIFQTTGSVQSLDVSSFAAENGFYESERATAGSFRVVGLDHTTDYGEGTTIVTIKPW